MDMRFRWKPTWVLTREKQRTDPLRSDAVPEPAVRLTLSVETSKQHNRLLCHSALPPNPGLLRGRRQELAVDQ
jgi:hypothetical protein